MSDGGHRTGSGRAGAVTALLAATLAAAPGAASAQAGGALEAGRARAAACAVCHGADGLSVVPDAPHLAAMPAVYFIAQLRAYRSGARRHEVMAVMARTLSDDDIANLAAWYGSIKLTATPP
jgi:cytochrome c553